jgi:hypothetical protein
MEHTLNATENKLAGLESLESGIILDGDGDRDHESELLRLDVEVAQLRKSIVSSFVARLNLVEQRLAQIIARVDHESCRRREMYVHVLDAVEKAADSPALANLKTAARQQLPAAMWQRPELQEAIRRADDRLLMAELEAFEKQERAALYENLNSVRGVELANLLFREYAIDLATARKLVIERNKGHIDLDQLLDRVLEMQRSQREMQRSQRVL